MFWAVLVVRVVLGLPFFLVGLDHFLHFIPKPDQAMSENAAKFGGALMDSGYMTVIKVLELTGGALVLSGRLVPLGLVLLTPVAINILLFEIFLVGSGGPGVAFTVLCMVLIWVYRSHFAAVFAVKPKIG